MRICDKCGSMDWFRHDGFGYTAMLCEHCDNYRVVGQEGMGRQVLANIRLELERTNVLWRRAIEREEYLEGLFEDVLATDSEFDPEKVLLAIREVTYLLATDIDEEDFAMHTEWARRLIYRMEVSG